MLLREYKLIKRFSASAQGPKPPGQGCGGKGGNTGATDPLKAHPVFLSLEERKGLWETVITDSC